MIPFAAISDEFKLDLEPHFSQLLADYISARSCGSPAGGHNNSVLSQLNSDLFPLLEFKELLAGLPDTSETWNGAPPLTKGEFLSLDHQRSPDAAYSLLSCMFNQFSPNNMFKIAWVYLAEDAERKYGVLFIERHRGNQQQEENVIYELLSFIHVVSQDRVIHYSHHLDDFEIDKRLRMNLVSEGFRKTGELIKACNKNPRKILMFNIANIYSSIINPLYKFFLGVSEGGGR